MNKNQKLLVFLFIIVISVFVFTYMIPKNKEGFQSNFNFEDIYIKGEKGAQGPAGPRGPTGPKGADGPACKNIIEYLENRGHLSLGEAGSSDKVDVSAQLELKGNIISNSSNFSKLKITDYNNCYPILVGNSESDADFYLKKTTNNCKMFIRGDIDINGQISFKDNNDAQQSIDATALFYSLAPVGLIANFYTNRGSEIPVNWAICNGQVVDGFQTPDLRGKFVRGTSTMSENGKTNDSEFNTTTRTKDGNISLSTNNMPVHTHPPTSSNGSHTHTATLAQAGEHDHQMSIQAVTPAVTQAVSGSQLGSAVDENNKLNTLSSGAHTHSATISQNGAHQHTINSAGSGEPFNILPPYMALVYIIKYK
jgi:microcystin-dependent protein